MTDQKPYWPWNQEPSVKKKANGHNVLKPKVCVVTPSFNQGNYLEETIRSVLLQDYPHIEYVIMDGGSTDCSVDIIRKYEGFLHSWVSERDNGQAQAVKTAWSKSDAKIVAYLNSDDTFLPGAISSAVEELCANPYASAVSGGGLAIDQHGMVIRKLCWGSTSLLKLLQLNYLFQPSTFIRKSYYEQTAGIDISFNNIFDHDLWIRLSEVGEIMPVTCTLATIRWHEETKSARNRVKIANEQYRCISGYLKSMPMDESVCKKIRKNLFYRVSDLYFESPAYFIKGAILLLRLGVIYPEERINVLGTIRKALVSIVRRQNDKSRKIFSARNENLKELHWSEFSDALDFSVMKTGF